jgi:hypothetical protein
MWEYIFVKLNHCCSPHEKLSEKCLQLRIFMVVVEAAKLFILVLLRCLFSTQISELLNFFLFVEFIFYFVLFYFISFTTTEVITALTLIFLFSVDDEYKKN